MRIKQVVWFLIAVVVLWLIYPVVRNMYWYKWMNPLLGIYSVLVDDTYWYPGYSDKAFKSIELGQKSEEVKIILGGPPLVVDEESDGDIVWHYTTGQCGGTLSAADSTHIRAIIFDKSMRVTAIGYRFYFD